MPTARTVTAAYLGYAAMLIVGHFDLARPERAFAALQAMTGAKAENGANPMVIDAIPSW